ncbi:hypothetical protein D3C83_91500 [compost metagenome]
MSSVAPSTISIRTTFSAVMRPSAVWASFDLPETRRPLIRMFCLAWPKPRSSSSSPETVNPGMLPTMSAAVSGANRTKKSGS